MFRFPARLSRARTTWSRRSWPNTRPPSGPASPCAGRRSRHGRPRPRARQGRGKQATAAGPLPGGRPRRNARRARTLGWIGAPEPAHGPRPLGHRPARPRGHDRPRERRRQRVGPAGRARDQGRQHQRRPGHSGSVDGIDVTDPYVLGMSDVNFDFDAIETISVTTGGAADVDPADGRPVREHGHPPRRQQALGDGPVLPDRQRLPEPPT
ncbi:MAG: hypothetical protein MZU84_01840 [Sphingobacterium sp.]|nr:hypothetical protein [Sphingobacterium sp.]